MFALPQASERVYLVSDLGKLRLDLRQDDDFFDFDSGFPKDLQEEEFSHYVQTVTIRSRTWNGAHVEKGKFVHVWVTPSAILMGG